MFPGVVRRVFRRWILPPIPKRGPRKGPRLRVPEKGPKKKPCKLFPCKALRSGCTKIRTWDLYLISYGTATIRNSTISGNSASCDGGGVDLRTGRDFFSASSYPGATCIQYSTISGNQADADSDGYGWGGGLCSSDYSSTNSDKKNETAGTALLALLNEGPLPFAL